MTDPTRRALILALALALAGCRHRVVDWTPDPRVAHSDTAFVRGGSRIVVERMAPLGHGRHPAILVLHPSDGTDGSGGQYVRRFADEFALNGYVCYVVHYFDRTATARSNDALEDEEFPIWTATLRDAVTFAQHDPRVEPRHVGAFGFSLGGYMALALGASDRRVGGLVVLSGGFFDALAPTVRHLPPTLLLHGDADDVVPLAAARKVDSTLDRLGVAHRLVVFRGQGHGFDETGSRDAARRAVLFFDRHLQGRWWELQTARLRVPSDSDSTRAGGGAGNATAPRPPR